MKRTPFTIWELKEGRASPWLTSAGTMITGWLKFFATLYISANDCKSTKSINLGLQINFSEEAILQIQNPQTMKITCMYILQENTSGFLFNLSIGKGFVTMTQILDILKRKYVYIWLHKNKKLMHGKKMYKSQKKTEKVFVKYITDKRLIITNKFLNP